MFIKFFMPGVIGKKQYRVYLTESEVEYLRSRIEYKAPNTGGLSALLDDYVCKLAKTMRASGHKPGEKMTWAHVVKMFLKGIVQ